MASKNSGGGLDKAAKIKAGASIAAIIVAMGFLAWHFDLIGGDQVAAEAAALQQEEMPTPEEQKQMEEEMQEHLEWMEAEGVQPAGA
jgi:hypothetical protein